jgi:3-deoxy-manno-octulosonate cytidylyltransferase (CMP-KDO synthetase)
MRIVAIIPSRYYSTRLEGKPLIDIAGKPMIQWVYESAQQAQLVDRVIVATDDKRILETVARFGGEAELTSPHHLSGTDRIAEAADRLSCDIIINLQGDEPLMEPRLVDEVARLVKDNTEVYMASAQSPITKMENLMNPNVVKVVADCNGYALYFSRAPIPYFSAGE